MLQASLRFALAKEKTEDIDSLCALCQQALAIGEISCDDAIYLHNWIKENKGLSDVWPASIIYARLSIFLQDGILDQKETGRHEATPYGYNAPSPFPLDAPAPDVIIPDHSFCFTGTFAFGNREACVEQLEALGGTFKKGMSRKVNYLVIGSLSNPHWAHATYGRKIEKAMTLKATGSSTAIISEEQWIEELV
jgi:NAD-dependent DNA ligase